MTMVHAQKHVITMIIVPNVYFILYKFMSKNLVIKYITKKRIHFEIDMFFYINWHFEIDQVKIDFIKWLLLYMSRNMVVL